MSYNQVTIKTIDLLPFYGILQQGIAKNINPGCTLKQLLCDQFNISPNYIETRIKTAFLNQKPVDNYDSAIVHDKDTLALSGAMPGLVGATFRKNSILSAFRRNISYRDFVAKKDASQNGNGKITIKLFNLLVNEIGPGLLESGILFQSEQLINIIKTECSKKESLFKSIKINGVNQFLKNDRILCNFKNDEIVFLKVQLFQYEHFFNGEVIT
jgi:hypothetical protein